MIKKQEHTAKQLENDRMKDCLRKVSTVGATSALLGTLAVMGTHQVQADETVETPANVPTETASATSETPTALASTIQAALQESEEAGPASTLDSQSSSEQASSSTVEQTSTVETTQDVTAAPIASSENVSAETASTQAQVYAASPVETSSPAGPEKEVLDQLDGPIKTVVENALTPEQIQNLTPDEITALNQISFYKDTIKGTGTSLTYRNLKDIVASFLKQDSKLAVPYFKADSIINMPAFHTVDAQTMTEEDIDVWDSWPVQDAASGMVSNWNGYQLVISMAGAPNKNSNHIYLLYNKYGDNDFTHWKNAGPIFGYNALEDDQQWSGSATVNSDGSIQLFYTKNDTSDGKLNWQQLASATLNLAVENDEVVLKSVENDHILFGGDGYHYQNYPQFMATFNDDHNKDGNPDRTDNYCLRDPHIIEDNGSRYLIFEANTGTENYQGEQQIFDWSNYGGDEAFNLASFLNIVDNPHLYNLASWANGAIGILKLDDNEKNPSVAEVYTPLVTTHLVTDEVERPSVVKVGDKYYLFTASRINKSTDAEGTMAAREAVGDDVVMLGFVSDSLRGTYTPLNGSGVVLTASVPADWRTSTYSYYAVPVEGSSDTLLVTSYMTNRGGIAGADNKSTWAPSFLIKVNPDDTTEVLPEMTNQGDWIWDASSASLTHVGDNHTAKLPDEDYTVDYYSVAGYGLKPHSYPSYPTVDADNSKDSSNDQTTPTDPSSDQSGGVSDPNHPETDPNTGVRDTDDSGIEVPITDDTSADKGHVDVTGANQTEKTDQSLVQSNPFTPSYGGEDSYDQVPLVTSNENTTRSEEASTVVQSATDTSVELTTTDDNQQQSASQSATDKAMEGKQAEAVAAKIADHHTPSKRSSTVPLLPILAGLFVAIATLAALGYGLVTGKISLGKK